MIHNDDPTPETLAHLVEVQPMRRLVSLVCSRCTYEWIQPAAFGNCPRCHAPSVATGAVRVSALRVA